MEKIYQIITNTNLDFKDKRHLLCLEAENSLPYPEISQKTRTYLEEGTICDIFEGHAPYRPRYILPDYLKFMKQGSEYLNISPPKNLFEAINALLVIYRFVPSITGYPVYLGQIDDLLEPFLNTVFPQEAENLLRLFLVNIDRTLPDAFVHLNIGPLDSQVSRLILRLEKELKHSIPNLSLKYSCETPDDLAMQAIDTALVVGKPYFVNHEELVGDLGKDYAVASCYNTLLIGGGSHTLVRLNLKKVAEKSTDYGDFINNKLPEAILLLVEIINTRAKFIVEKAKFFETSFLAKEGLINLTKFTSMAGFYGLYEAVKHLTNLSMGKDVEAEKYALEITSQARDLLDSYTGLYCEGYCNKIGFHAQSGIDTDVGVTAGVRIKYGEEPLLYEQVNLEGKLHPYFNAGISDLYTFDPTAKENPAGILKIIKTAMKKGIRIFALTTTDSEFVRVTGYLVKKTDIEKYHRGELLREDTVKLGADSIRNNETLKRRVHGKP
ncbi:MAG: hypothetical protein DDT23_01192 [candidate division WS2 bacterium]|nr:hypothetical protein [Candidatus Lithacetigena glycinireducens]